MDRHSPQKVVLCYRIVLFQEMRTTVHRVLVIILVTLLICVGIASVLPFILPGGPHLFRRTGPTEVLNDPRSVQTVSPHGLILVDGSLVKIPYVAEIPTNLPVLQEAIKRGVEVDRQGHVVGLIKVWHWCGNDPIRSHVGRIDLSGLLLFAGARPDQSVPTNEIPVGEKIEMRKWGLNISQYMSMQMIKTAIEMGTEQGGGTVRR